MDDKELERLAQLQARDKEAWKYGVVVGLWILAGFVMSICVWTWVENIAIAVLVFLLSQAVVHPLLYWNYRVELKRREEKELLELKREQKLKQG
jgi:hypothetical protein